MDGLPIVVAPVRAPVVAGVAGGAERSALLAAASAAGLQVMADHAVGGDRSVIELTPDGTGDGAGDGDPDRLVATAVARLRARGLAVVAGPRSPDHAVMWGRRNGPSRFAPGACVCFPWTPGDRGRWDLAVEIDPGSGFGAGGHPTTLGLLAGLADPELMAASSGPSGLSDLGGRRVLDVGCGTGVLAIAAALLGSSAVGAVDIAPEALAATRSNVSRNQVVGRVVELDVDLGRCLDPFDVVVANIHADVLLSLAPDLRRLTAPAGILGLGGLSPSQPSRLEAALQPMRVVRLDDHGDWVSLWLRHQHAEQS